MREPYLEVIAQLGHYSDRRREFLIEFLLYYGRRAGVDIDSTWARQGLHVYDAGTKCFDIPSLALRMKDIKQQVDLLFTQSGDYRWFSG